MYKILISLLIILFLSCKNTEMKEAPKKTVLSEEELKTHNIMKDIIEKNFSSEMKELGYL